MKPLAMTVILVTATAVGPGAFAALPPIGLRAVIGAAEKANRFLSASKLEETVAEKRISVAKGDFLPHIEADALGTNGFTGSSSLLGISGLTGASHFGYATGLMASETLWDFGRTLNRVRAAAHLSEAQKAQTELTRLDIDREAARLYFECARFNSQLDAWSFITSQAQLVAKEVEHFVATGQRSIVERYLSSAQVEEASTAKTDYAEKLRLSRERLHVYTKLPAERVTCPLLGTIRLEDAVPAAPIHPLVRRSSEEALAARAQVNLAKDDFLPKLKAFAGVGWVQNGRTADDYAVGVGVVLPIFDGFKTLNEVEGAEANERSKEDLIGASHDEIDQVNARYNQLTESAKVRLAHLSDELKIADKAFNVAKSRYFSLQGTLIDLREALRNLMRTRSAEIDTKAEYLFTITEQRIFNEQIRRE